MSTAPSRDDETELPSSSAQQGDTVEERDLSPADLEPRGDTPEKHTSSSANGTDDDDDDFREQALTAGKTASMAVTAAQSRRPWRRIDQEDAESIASSTDVPSASTRKTGEADSLLHDTKSDVNESSAPPETLANNVEKAASIGDQLSTSIARDAPDAGIRQRKRNRASPELAEGDIELLREAGVTIPERHVRSHGRRRRRLRQAADLESASEEASREGTPLTRPTDVLQDELGTEPWTASAPQGADDAEAASLQSAEESVVSEDEDDDVDDDLEDFIDYGDGEAGRRRRRLARQRARAVLKASRSGRSAAGVDTYAVTILRELFGDPEALSDYCGEPLLYHGDPEQIRSWLHNLGIDEPIEVEQALSLDTWPAEAPPETSSTPDQDQDGSKTTRSPVLSVEQSEMLTELYATTRDDAIRALDIPEYTQLYHLGSDQTGRPLPREIMDDSDIRYEAEWIVTNGLADLRRSSETLASETALVDQVANLLRFLHLERLDVAHIAMYRREYLEPDLLTPLNASNIDGQRKPVLETPAHFVGDWTRLWRALEWDRRYFQFLQQKRRLMDWYEEHEEQELFMLASGAFRREMLLDVDKYARLRHQLSRMESNKHDEDAANLDSHRGSVTNEVVSSDAEDAVPQRSEQDHEHHPAVIHNHGTMAMQHPMQATTLPDHAHEHAHASPGRFEVGATVVDTSSSMLMRPPQPSSSPTSDSSQRFPKSSRASANGTTAQARHLVSTGSEAADTASRLEQESHRHRPGVCRPSRRDPLHIAMAWVRAHQIDVEALYGLRCADLAANVLSGGSRVVEPSDQPNKRTLDQLLEQWQRARPETAHHGERPLFYIRQVAAALYAAHPRLRHFVRTKLRDRARLEVQPSSRALQDLDVLDPLRPYCAVRDLPVATLQPTEMALFMHAERLGLVERMQCTLPAADWAELESILERALLSDKLFESAQQWNAARKAMLTEQLMAVWLVPPLLDELLSSLREEARASLCMQATVAFERQLVIGGAGWGHDQPLPHRDRQGVLAETAAGLVLAFVVTDQVQGAGPESIPRSSSDRIRSGRWVFGVALDACGQVLDAIRLGGQGWLSNDERLLWQRTTLGSSVAHGDSATADGRGDASVSTKALQRVPLPSTVRDTLERFLRRHSRRDCVVVGVGSGSSIGVNAASLCLYDHLRDLERRLRSNEAAVDASTGRVRRPLEALVRRLDDDVARLYAKTKAVRAPLGGPVPPECDVMSLRIAIGLARLCQEPLAVYATIASEPALGALLRLQERQRQKSLGSFDSTVSSMSPDAAAEASSYEHSVPRGSAAYDLDVDGMLTEPSDRLVAVERALRHAIASVGLDLNLLLRYSHLRPMMHFAPGMGIRKASVFFAILGKQYGSGPNGLVPVASRQAVQRSGAVTPRVAESLLAFLRIRDATRERPLASVSPAERAQEQLVLRKRRAWVSDDSAWRPLDDTRIHPADEALATKIALESLRERDPAYWDAKRVASTPASVLVLHLLEHPEAMDELDLPGYATYLEQAGHGRKRHTLFLIECEFYHPFADWRQVRVSLQDKALFYACTGLDERLFGYGTRVHAYDGRAVQRGTAWHCRLVATGVSGASDVLPGRIESTQIAAVWQQIQKQTRATSLLPTSLRPGTSNDPGAPSVSASVLASETVLPLRVQAVSGETLQVQLMPLEPLPPDLAAVAAQVSQMPFRVPLVAPTEPAAATTTTTSTTTSAASVQSRQALVLQRATSLLPTSLLRHPSYRPISGRQAVAELATAPPGAVCFRPSSRQPQALCASFKIHEQAPIVHLDLEVEQVLDGTTAAAAGARVPLATEQPRHWRLRLGTELYDDLDEVLARYIEPVVQHALEATQHPKFVLNNNNNNEQGDEALQTLLRQEKAASPSGIPYRLAFSRQRPAHLVFAYLPGRSTVFHEPITLTPSGYRLRDQSFSSLNSLINWFKRNWQRLLHTNRAGQPERPVPASTMFATMTEQGLDPLWNKADTGPDRTAPLDSGMTSRPGGAEGALGISSASSLAQLAQRALERSGTGAGVISRAQRPTKWP